MDDVENKEVQFVIQFDRNNIIYYFIGGINNISADKIVDQILSTFELTS